MVSLWRQLVRRRGAQRQLLFERLPICGGRAGHIRRLLTPIEESPRPGAQVLLLRMPRYRDGLLVVFFALHLTLSWERATGGTR